MHNLVLPPDSEVVFGDGFVLKELPLWVTEEQMLKNLSYTDRQSIPLAKCALMADYEAASIGEPDPSAAPGDPKSIQGRKFNAVLLANFALWLAQPSKACFTTVFHGLHWDVPGQSNKQPIIQQIERQNPMYCHPAEVANTVSLEQANEAGRFHAVLLSVPRKNPVWRAMRMYWAGLTNSAADIRYSLFWIGLEALFGPDGNTGEITYKLSQRAAFFISNTPQDARDVFGKAKKCYAMRSKIVHGLWEYDPSIDITMADTEMIVRASCRRLLTDPEMLKTFMSKKRDQFLEEWVFSRSTDTPPFP
jgi:hypothetical protein